MQILLSNMRNVDNRIMVDGEIKQWDNSHFMDDVLHF